jgi:hypothetical protein
MDMGEFTYFVEQLIIQEWRYDLQSEDLLDECLLVYCEHP